MVREIAPVFFTMDIPATLAYYIGKLGFECLGTWQDPPVYAIVARDQQAIHFRCAEPPIANPDKYLDELLDAYLFVEDADALYAEYAAQGVEFTPLTQKVILVARRLGTCVLRRTRGDGDAMANGDSVLPYQNVFDHEPYNALALSDAKRL